MNPAVKQITKKTLSISGTMDLINTDDAIEADAPSSGRWRLRGHKPNGGRRESIIRSERRCYTQDHVNDAYPMLREPPSFVQTFRRNYRCSVPCILKSLLSFLPVLQVVKKYSWSNDFCMDILCGLSVGFLHLPQGLGFGLLADLSPVHGLYTSFFPVLVYAIFGTSPHVSMGTNAVVALLSASVVDKERVRFLAGKGENETVSPAALMDFKVGVSAATALVQGLILIAMGLLRLGFLTNYMSNSFIGGFSFAAAVHITVSQIVKLFNLKVEIYFGLGKLIFTTVDVFKNIMNTNLGDVLVGVLCGVLLLAINEGINARYKHRLRVPVPAELIVVILSTVVSHFAQLNQRFNINVVGEVPQGMPVPSIPPFEVMPRIITNAVVDAVLIFVLTISLAKLTAKLHVISIDDNQELLAYGLCQVVGSFFQNFSSSISPPRTMMLSSMGVKSTLNGFSTAVFILLVLLVAGQLFVSLPIAMLSVMIIVAMKGLLLQVVKLKELWYVNKGDFFIWMLTVLFGVLGDLDVGLLAGVLSSMVMVLAYSQLAKGTVLGKAASEDLILDMDREGIYPIPGLRIFRFESQLHFASAERFKSEIYRKIFDPTSTRRKDHYEIEVIFPPSPAKSLQPSILEVSSTEQEHTETRQVEERQPENGAHTVYEECVDGDPHESHVGGEQHQEIKNGEPLRTLNQDEAPVVESRPASLTPVESSARDVSNNARETSFQSCSSTYRDLVRHIILDCSTMTYIDLTGVEMLHLIITQYARAGVAMLLTDIPPTTLAILNRVKFFEHEDFSKVYFNVQDALHAVQSLQASRSYVKSFA